MTLVLMQFVPVRIEALGAAVDVLFASAALQPLILGFKSPAVVAVVLEIEHLNRYFLIGVPEFLFIGGVLLAFFAGVLIGEGFLGVLFASVTLNWDPRNQLAICVYQALKFSIFR